MTINETGSPVSLQGLSNENQERPWLFRYRWHFVFWIAYFLYSFGTDKLNMGKYMSFSKEAILITTHHIYLFYTLLYCLKKFEFKPTQKLLISIGRFALVIVVFHGVRILVNFRIFPMLSVAEGVEFYGLSERELAIKTIFWVTEFFIKAFAFFYFYKFEAEQTQRRKMLVEFYEQKMALDANKVKAERAEQVKQEYSRLETTFINLVHETKTPLTLINNCITEHIALHGSSPELEVAKKGLNKLSNEISNIFDIERFKHGKGIYNHDQVCNFSQIVADNVTQYQSHARRKKIEINSLITADLHTVADPSSLHRVVNNLLENAVKYSGNDTMIYISLTGNSGQVTFKIDDAGIGIDDDDLEKIFVPYLQLNKDKKNIQGLGLGLPLVKSILDELGSTISIKNKKANNMNGISIEFSLPLAEKGETGSVAGVYEHDSLIDADVEISDVFHSREHPTILIVEDNVILNSYMVTKLGQKFNVKFALNGRNAIEILKSEIPDLIISDVMMDEMDGFEMAGIIAGNPNYSHIPIIFLTARSADKDKVHGISLGAVDYIEKPFSLELLLNKVDSILAQRDKRDQKLFNAAYQSMKSLLQTSEVNKQESPGDVFNRNCQMYDLTKTQIEIARLLIEGKTMKTIASDRNISESTVETHRRNLYEKLLVSNKTELIKKLTS